jgi:hypothetical protein
MRTLAAVLALLAAVTGCSDVHFQDDDTYLLGYDTAAMVDVQASGLTTADKRTKVCQQFRDAMIKEGGLAPGKWSELDFMIGCQDGLAGRPADVTE